MNKQIYAVYEKYMLWSIPKMFVLTDRKQREIMQGSYAECKEFMEKFPYGITKKELEEYRRKTE